MGTINLYSLNKEEVINLLRHSPRYADLYKHMIQYSKENNPGQSDIVYELTACEFVYQQCAQVFQYCDYIHTVSEALDRVDEKRKQGYFKLKSSSNNSGGCYIATCIYGSYDCPQVWTLRRYRDYTLAQTWFGRAFIRAYYVISPIIVKHWGHYQWFQKLWKKRLDRWVKKLELSGVANTPYDDLNW